MSTTEVVHDVRPVSGWTVRMVWHNEQDDRLEYETLPMIGWAVVLEYVTDRHGGLEAATGERTIQPAAWEPTEARVATLSELEESANVVAVVAPPGTEPDDEELAAQLRSKVARHRGVTR